MTGLYHPKQIGGDAWSEAIILSLDISKGLSQNQVAMLLLLSSNISRLLPSKDDFIEVIADDEAMLIRAHRSEQPEWSFCFLPEQFEVPIGGIIELYQIAMSDFLIPIDPEVRIQ